MRRLLCLCGGVVFLPLAVGGCAPSWQTRFPKGTRLYERPGHNYFGKVVGFDPRHQFSKDAGVQPAILIEQAAGGARIWGSCQTCADAMDVEKPERQPLSNPAAD